MFTQPATSPLSLPTATSAASPTTPSRTGRLRGLSYLRSYTHNHLTSHSFQHSNTTPQRNSLLRSTSHPTQSSSERSYTNGPAADLPELQVQPPSITGEASSDQSEGSSTSGWLPTVGGLSGLSRVATQPQPTSAAAPSVRANSSTSSSAGNVKKAIKMARHRRSESNPQGSRSGSLFPTPLFSAEAMNFGRLQGTAEVETQEKANDGEIPLSSTSLQAPLPTVRFLPHHDPRSARPSLAFPPISRTLPDSSSIIKVGRYSERDSNPTPAPNTPSAAPVGFKSKVVSRKHCEFWCSNGQWYVKDVKSSSGTFLNHIRLSQPNVESRPFPVNDGDVVQLGIDFRGGEEMIFRCVKIRVECNRAWQKGLNNFNMSTHKRLRNLAKPAPNKDGDASSTHTSECSICLMSVAPCQSLFVAPCSHVWHYKCIRPILNDHRTWPQFLCPNCRAVTDLEADADDPYDYEEQGDEEADDSADSNGTEKARPSTGSVASNGVDAGTGPTQLANGVTAQKDAYHDISEDMTTRVATASVADDGLSAEEPEVSSSLLSRRNVSSNSMLQHGINATQPVPLTGRTSPRSSNSGTDQDGDTSQLTEPSSTLRATTPTAGETLGPEGPMTPRNDAGPFVFDGSAGRASGRRAVASLAEAATETTESGT